MCILYPLEVLTQLISEPSTPFKYVFLRSESCSSQHTTHGKLRLKHFLGTVCLKKPKIIEAGKSLLDINTCDGSSCQLESPGLALFLWVQEEVLSIPCLCLFHFPQYIPFINLGNASSPLENISHLIHATVVSRAEKWVQMHSVLLEVNVRVYTHTQMLPSCLLLLKDKIFKLQLSGQDEAHPCSETVSLGLKCFALVEDTPAYEEMCPEVSHTKAKLWMSRTKTPVLQFACLQSGCLMWDCLRGTPVKSCCVIYSILKNGEIPFECVHSSEAKKKVG